MSDSRSPAYWVCSDGDAPLAIHFKERDAIQFFEYAYIDVFDSNGERIDDLSLKLEGGIYVDNF